LFLSHGTLEDYETFLPRDLAHWLAGSMKRLIAEPDTTLHPKSNLQEQLETIRMHWEYRCFKNKV
jgi:hypothetical protein